jgi:hypothetical protein
MTAPERFADGQIPLAPRAPSIHGPQENLPIPWQACRLSGGQRTKFCGPTEVLKTSKMTSGPEDFHLRALPEPYVNLSIHTAPIVRPLPWHSDQWARSLGFARRNRSNQSLAPLVWWRIRLNLRRAHLMT